MRYPSNTTITIPQCGMVAAARWIAKLSTPCLIKALSDHPDYNIKIVDRPTQDHMFLSREYIQPQWIFECVNARIILPTDEYLVGRVLPPHLSPFVDNDVEGYVPDYAHKIKQLQAAANKQVLPLPSIGDDDVEDTQNLLLEGVASRKEEAIEKKQKERT